ncbi:NAD/NADP octopine/nopaline dehydrogenase family protein [Leptolyngbya cf. ectocarpi LEGE 11479]|uniref:NAD/NADP octopine/nopaline dehydrogenase family protein n=1 Tax=Leptolyngbya cf. ectocarpi LEGE 11479 TaxID=1828722 RepID=A0A929FBD7_LEPEC|nr:NAD/NADP octopine/nopaline dehydrogenase family protein [Leptolyngbya ectocarpi]MBE9069037.1 NAD/NADP octopine/nopaline dehydrogenase family protein [Leptolyngbya cf. ectocarpi LEGE 11479]
MSPQSFLVIGGGHIGLASVVYLSSQGHTVYLISRRASTTHSQTIQSSGPIAQGSFPVALYSNRFVDIAAVHRGRLPSNIILCCRGQDLQPYAEQLSSYCQPGMNILLLCAARFAGRAFSQLLQQTGVPKHRLPAIADVHNMPFISRGNGQDQVAIKALTNKCFVAAQSPELTERLVSQYQPLFKHLYPLPDALAVNLNKCNDIIHVPLIWASFAQWETGEDYNPYYNLGPQTVQLIEMLDRDRVTIGQNLGVSPLIDICQHYQLAYGTKGPSLFEHVQQLHAYSCTNVGNPQHRYLTEDLPFGLFPLQALAKTALIETPVLDSYITLGRSIVEPKPYWTADFLGLKDL